MTDKSETVNALDKAAAHIIQESVKGMDAAMGFLSDQIPDVVRQVLLWELSWSIFMVVLFVSLTFFSMHLRKVVVVFGKSINDDPAIFFGSVFTIIGSIISAVIAIVHLKTALMIVIAPKVYLIRYAADLLK